MVMGERASRCLIKSSFSKVLGDFAVTGVSCGLTVLQRPTVPALPRAAADKL